MARYLHTMYRITDPERSRAFYEALGFEFRGDFPIVRDGRLEATNYFFAMPGQKEELFVRDPDGSLPKASSVAEWSGYGAESSLDSRAARFRPEHAARLRASAARSDDPVARGKEARW